MENLLDSHNFTYYCFIWILASLLLCDLSTAYRCNPLATNYFVILKPSHRRYWDRVGAVYVLTLNNKDSFYRI